MRKIISVLTLAILLALPLIASAQKNCCQLRGTIKYDETVYHNGIWISETKMAAKECADAQTKPINTACDDRPYKPGPPVEGENKVNCYTPRWGILCVLSTVNRIFSLVFVILMAIVGIMVIVGAFMIVTAGGSPDKVNQGKNYIMYAVAGMVVAFFARAIPAIVALVL